MIPKILFQKSVKKPTDDDKRLVTSPFSEWEYLHFNDKEALKYIVENTIEDFPDAHRSYLKYKNGAHQADFFRYWFLYLNGGFYVDSDLVIYKNLEYLTDKYSFISCEGSAFDFLKNTIFQGLLIANKKNEIIFQCLKSMYNLEDLSLCNSGSVDGYLSLTKRMYSFVKSNKVSKIKLFDEEAFSYISPIDNNQYIAFFIKDNTSIVGVHWQQEKIIHRLEDVLIV